MLLAVFSDTHGKLDLMRRAVEACRPDVVLHLGDFVRDAQALQGEFPGLDIRFVRGNCDVGSDAPDKLLFPLEDVPIFMTHGHMQHVKFTLDYLLTAAHFTQARLVLFGHTHEALCREEGSMTVLNPGSAGTGRDPTWARVDLIGGSAQCRIFRASEGFDAL